MKIRIEGTKSELIQLWDFDKVCELIHVDPYKWQLVSHAERFVLTEDDFKRVGLLKE